MMLNGPNGLQRFNRFGGLQIDIRMLDALVLEILEVSSVSTRVERSLG